MSEGRAATAPPHAAQRGPSAPGGFKPGRGRGLGGVPGWGRPGGTGGEAPGGSRRRPGPGGAGRARPGAGLPLGPVEPGGGRGSRPFPSRCVWGEPLGPDCGITEERVEGKGKGREHPLKIHRAPPLSVSLTVGRSRERHRGPSCCLRPPRIRQGGSVWYRAALTYIQISPHEKRAGENRAGSTVLRSPAEPGSLLGSFFRKKTK